MKNLKAKMKKQGGFTLVEMLVVVAIIAILVMVSIPVVNASLESAKEATDAANLRAAKAIATISFLNGDDLAANAVYSVENGNFNGGASDAYGQSSAHKGQVIEVKTASTDSEPATVGWTTSG